MQSQAETTAKKKPRKRAKNLHARKNMLEQLACLSEDMQRGKILHTSLKTVFDLYPWKMFSAELFAHTRKEWWTFRPLLDIMIAKTHNTLQSRSKPSRKNVSTLEENWQARQDWPTRSESNLNMYQDQRELWRDWWWTGMTKLITKLSVTASRLESWILLTECWISDLYPRQSAGTIPTWSKIHTYKHILNERHQCAKAN